MREQYLANTSRLRRAQDLTTNNPILRGMSWANAPAAPSAPPADTTVPVPLAHQVDLVPPEMPKKRWSQVKNKNNELQQAMPGLQYATA